MPHNTKTPPAECSGVEQATVPVTSDADILLARQRARGLAAEVDFTAVESTKITAVVSELARNILQYAGRGDIVLRALHQENRTGVMVVARDKGPGISDVRNALQDGFSTNGGLGLGLPLVRRLMDEFEIVSHHGHGTTVIVKKWARRCTSGRPGRTARASFERRDGEAAGKLAAVGSVSR
jgi:serine/threonine-protein kinase RsbT